MSIFKCLSYYEFLEEVVARNSGQRAFKSKLAIEMGCSKSLLSQVLKRELHLTLDHGVRLARYLGLDSAETEYLLQLITYEKAGTTELKEHIQLNLGKSRRDQLELSKHLGDSTHSLQPEDLALYCSHWLYPFLHMHALVDDVRSPGRIAEKTGYPESLIRSVYSTLQKMGLVTSNGSEFTLTNTEFHVPKTSPLASASHISWRNRTVSELQIKPQHGTHYSGVHVLDEESYLWLQEELVQLSKRVREKLVTSKNEKIAFFSFDLYSLWRSGFGVC